MTITEKLEAKRAEFVSLKDAIEAGDAEAIDKAEGIKSDIDQLEKQADLSAAAKSQLAKLGNQKSEQVKKQEAFKSLGEFAAAKLDLTGLRIGSSKSAGTGFAYKAATDVHTSYPMEVVDRTVVDIPRQLDFRNLFGSETISGTSLKYFVMGETEGAPAVVQEGAQKPQFHIPYTAATANLMKIAGWYYETDELVEDNEFLRSSIDSRGLYELDLAVESFLTGALMEADGLGRLNVAVSADAIFQAMTQVKSATNFNADAIVINPTDYQALRLAKDGASQYYGGGYFYGPYGNGQVSQQPGLWGLNTVVTNAVAAGTVLVGAFRQGASVITKAGDGVRVEVVTGDHDDRTHNRVTVVVEERLGFAVRYPGAFVAVGQH